MPTRGFHTARVKRALAELKTHLAAAIERAKQIERVLLQIPDEPLPTDCNAASTRRKKQKKEAR